MSISAKHASSAATAWLYLLRARDAVSTAAAALPMTHLSPEKREEFALEVAELIGKAELLLSTLRQGNQAHAPAAAPEAPAP